MLGNEGSGRYLIGLTGNIATGKSTVASILEELGATVIDADQVAHHVMRRGTDVYDRIVTVFGPDIVSPDGEIDRQRLGQIVFSDERALLRLEEIVHPATRRAVGRRLVEINAPVVVIEAIKLIEAGWHSSCQALWVTTCPPQQQIARLVEGRGLAPEEARRRVAAQPPQREKVEMADVVIDTVGELEDTWRQVVEAWHATFEGGDMDESNTFLVERAKPSDAQVIADFVASATRGRVMARPDAVVTRFGAKGLWLVRDEDHHIVGLVGWRAENLVARIDDFLIYPPKLYPTAGKALVEHVEQAARELRCEVSMFLVPLGASPTAVRFFESCGYERPELEGLPRVWRETVEEATTEGRYTLLRKLREDLVMRPF
jgi:dephospho-CoA kinase